MVVEPFDKRTVHENIAQVEELVLVRPLVKQLLVGVPGPDPDRLLVPELFSEPAGDTEKHGGSEEWLATDEGQSRHIGLGDVGKDSFFEFLVVLLAVPEGLRCLVVATWALERAPGDVEGTPHSLAVDEIEWLVVSNVAGREDAALPLSGGGLRHSVSIDEGHG